MDPSPPRNDGGSSPTWCAGRPSSLVADVLDALLPEATVEPQPRPDEILGSGELPVVTSQLDLVPFQAPDVEMTPVVGECASDTALGGASSAAMAGGHQEKGAAVADVEMNPLVRASAIALGGASSAAMGAGQKEEETAVADVEMTPVVGASASASALGGSSSSAMEGGHQEEGTAVADAAAGMQMVDVVQIGFVPIIDVKAMLQTGRFHGQRVFYLSKRHKLNLLEGVIRGMAYYCSCGDCDHIGKPLSARAFELHAVKNGKETHNPNDHIILFSSNMSLFEACRKLKEATNQDMLEATFDIIMKSSPREAVPKQDVEVLKQIVEVPVTYTPADNSNLIHIIHNLEKRMESTEKRMEKLQSHVDTIEKNIDFINNEMARCQDMFEKVSDIMAKFVDEM